MGQNTTLGFLKHQGDSWTSAFSLCSIRRLCKFMVHSLFSSAKMRSLQEHCLAKDIEFRAASSLSPIKHQVHYYYGIAETLETGITISTSFMDCCTKQVNTRN